MRNDRPAWNVRALLESTGTPFSIAHYGEGEVLFRQGDACGSVQRLEHGRVRLAVTGPDGTEVICGLAEAGAFLGEEALAGQPVRRLTATAMTAVEVVVVDKRQMIRLLHTQPEVSDHFIAHILACITRLEDDLSDQLFNSCEQRLARTLLTLAGCDARGPARCVLPHVSQTIIAEMVGTTRSRVNVLLGRFKHRGFIESDRGEFRISPSLLQFVHRSD